MVMVPPLQLLVEGDEVEASTAWDKRYAQVELLERSKTVKPKEKKVQFLSSKANLEGMSILKKTARKSSSTEIHVSTNKQNRGLEKRAKSKFHEYLKMELSEGVVGAEEDLKIERRLAKKLLKGRNLGGPDDGLNLLIEGTPSFDDFSNAKHDIDDDGLKIKRQKRKHKDSSTEDEDKNRKRRKSSKAHANGLDECYPTNKTTDVGEQHNASNIEGPLNETMDTAANANYISPPSRAITTCESEEHVQFGLKVKRLLSKLVGSTVESTSGEVAKIFQSVTRSVGCEIVGEKIMTFCVCEEKGGEQGAAVFAAFIAGMACLVGVDFSAKILAYVARSFEKPGQQPWTVHGGIQQAVAGDGYPRRETAAALPGGGDGCRQQVSWNLMAVGEIPALRQDGEGGSMCRILWENRPAAGPLGNREEFAAI
ncbi:hypothetical protein KSP40_PGU009374 [Platanthera guangdongensis]|uniref:Uncharacterized protein n=1 Tax=Platanthera guangdongensis TaxID=2320717 RepID=A0ABR2LPK3_9ASPA